MMVQMRLPFLRWLCHMNGIAVANGAAGEREFERLSRWI